MKFGRFINNSYLCVTNRKIICLNSIEVKLKKFIRYTVCDYKPSNRKYPIIARNESGTKYKFSVSQVADSIIN